MAMTFPANIKNLETGTADTPVQQQKQYVGIYIKTSMITDNAQNLMIIKQVELSNSSGIELAKELYPLVLSAFKNNISAYYGQTSELGVYLSDRPYDTKINYNAPTFFTVVKNNLIIRVISDYLYPNENYHDKYVFNSNIRSIFPHDETINTICKHMLDFFVAKRTRPGTINLLKRLDPAAKINWYNTHSSLKRLCFKQVRDQVINVLDAVCNGVDDKHGVDKTTKPNKTSNTPIIAISTEV